MGWEFWASWEEVNVCCIWERYKSLGAKGQNMVSSLKDGPKDPHLLVFMSYTNSPLPYKIGLISVTNRLCWKWWCVTSELRSYKTLYLPPCPLLDHLLWENPTAMSWGYSSSPVDSGETSLEQPSEGAILEANLTFLVKSSNDYSPSQQLHWNLLSDPGLDHPAKTLPYSWLRNVWDNKSSLF